ncbi:e9imm peptide [Micromonospora sp. NPDC023737]|uniref:e9imm peptide n=1 Tax=unclassified Micromonospora TaxID=2617518 RepID=UPI0033C0776F
MRYDFADFAERGDWLDRLERDLGYPDISDLIYAVTPELTTAEVVDRASAYQPIARRSTPWTPPSAN